MEVAHAKLNIICVIRTFPIPPQEQRQRLVHRKPTGHNGISALTGCEGGGRGGEPQSRLHSSREEDRGDSQSDVTAPTNHLLDRQVRKASC